MSRQTEERWLIMNAVKSGGFVASICSICHWWRLKAGDKAEFEEKYPADIRCECTFTSDVNGHLPVSKCLEA